MSMRDRDLVRVGRAPGTAQFARSGPAQTQLNTVRTRRKGPPFAAVWQQSPWRILKAGQATGPVGPDSITGNGAITNDDRG